MPSAIRDDVMILSLKGSLDSITSGQVEKTLTTLLEKRMVRVVISLDDVNYISSAGWGIFIGMLKNFTSRKGELKLAGISKDIADIFNLLEIKDMIACYRTIDEAVRSFD